VHRALSYLREDDVVVCEGAIDERSDLTRLVDYAQDRTLILDLEGITFINSIGVRSWCHFIQLTRKLGITLEVRRAAERMVHQFNIVPAARALVTSFYAPYVCDHCGHEEDVLLAVADHGRDLARGRPPEVNCGDCGSALAFADPPELYFAFLVS
jgi:hypothetical protein